MKNLSVFDILRSLEAKSGRNDKLEILTKNKDNELLKRVVFLALDPFTQFYQKKIPEYRRSPLAAVPLVKALDRLSNLSTRQVTGNAAIEYLRKLLSDMALEDAFVLERIILKDLVCGVQESTANKVWKNLIPSYPCMLASAYDEKLIDKMNFPAIAQIKMDGMRFNAVVNATTKTVEYRSRNGKEVKINNWLLDEAFLAMAKNIGMAFVVFDGELIVVDDYGKPLDRKTGNGILNKAVKGTITDSESKMVRAILWDVIPMLYFQKERCDVVYKDRLATLVVAIDNLGDNLKYLTAVVETKIVNNSYEAQKVFENYYSQGQEGIILKDSEGIWENKRSKGQVKYKGELECDLMCTNWIPGSGKYKGMLGSLELRSSDGKINVSVGTGFTDDMRKSIRPEDVINKIIAVKYNARITSKNNAEDSLFLPVFIEIREDKQTADRSKDVL
jgi:hypothetical protein